MYGIGFDYVHKISSAEVTSLFYYSYKPWSISKYCATSQHQLSFTEIRLTLLRDCKAQDKTKLYIALCWSNLFLLVESGRRKRENNARSHILLKMTWHLQYFWFKAKRFMWRKSYVRTQDIEFAGGSSGYLPFEQAVISNEL